MNIEELNVDIFTAFHEDWALVTAGDISEHNSMTISWGSMGTIWNKPIVTIYVKPVRYTHDFIEKNDYFIVSFFKDDYRKALYVMGNKSGRNINKDEASGLTPLDHEGKTIYKEARITLICKKIYQNDLDISKIPNEAIKTYYIKEKPHTMYIGEVVELITK